MISYLFQTLPQSHDLTFI